MWKSLFYLLLFSFMFTVPASAADLAPRLFTPKAAPCTLQSCSGFYVGAQLAGEGGNADIIGGGLRNSVFAGGGLIGGAAGYQLWNGKYFAAVEIAGMYEVQSAPGTNVDGHRFTVMELVKVGIGLQGLFGPSVPAVPTPAQGETGISIPASLLQSLASPYVQTGAVQRGGHSQWASGAGMDFIIAQGWNLDVSYLYLAPNDGLPADNLVKLGLNRKF